MKIYDLRKDDPQCAYFLLPLENGREVLQALMNHPLATLHRISEYWWPVWRYRELLSIAEIPEIIPPESIYRLWFHFGSDSVDVSLACYGAEVQHYFGQDNFSPTVESISFIQRVAANSDRIVLGWELSALIDDPEGSIAGLVRDVSSWPLIIRWPGLLVRDNWVDGWICLNDRDTIAFARLVRYCNVFIGSYPQCADKGQPYEGG